MKNPKCSEKAAKIGSQIECNVLGNTVPVFDISTFKKLKLRY